MYKKEELDKKIEEFFYAGTIYCNLQKELKQFVSDYALECFNEGCNFEANRKSYFT